MRLTDKEIEINTNAKQFRHNGGWLPTVWEGYMEGQKEAREFYENQKCGTCGKKNTHYCRVREFIGSYDYISFDNHSQDFGCTEWEPKK